MKFKSRKIVEAQSSLALVSNGKTEALVLGEHITILAMVCTVAVLASIVGTQRARVERRA